MTFQPNNVYEPWRFEYVSYKLIKHNITQQVHNHGWLDRDESSFTALLWHEAEKVDRFITQKQREIESTLAHCRRRIEQHHSNNHTRETLRDVYCELQALCDFARHNSLALESLINYHDEITERNQRPLLVDIIRKRPLGRQQFDLTLIEVSKLMDTVTEQQEEQVYQQQQPTAVHFWVHRDNINQVLAVLHFHLSSSISRPTVTYLDNSRYELYQGRLERDEGAEEIRLKHFTSAAKDVFVERETYHAPWLNSQSVTDGFRLDSPDKADQFLSSQYTADECVRDLCTTDAERHTLGFIASGIQQSINDKNLRPTMRMTSERAVFQNQVLFDTNIVFIGDHTYEMPHAVLQTTLTGNSEQQHQQEPWLKQLLDDGLVYEVPCFSLFLHGMACMWPESIPWLPWWMDELDIDIRDSRQPKGFKSASQYAHSRSLRPKEEPLGYLNHELEYPRLPLHERPAMKQETFPARHEAINIDRDYFSDPVWQQHQDQFSSYDNNDNNDYDDAEQYQRPQRQMGWRNQRQQQEDDQEGQTLLGSGDENNREEQSSNKKKKNKKQKNPMLEPKVFFANERTFIHWLQFSALILVSALTLLNFGDRISTIAGGVFFGISMAIALYAFGRYRWRAYQIKTRPQIRYDDIYGPIGLCTLLVGAVILNFILRYQHPSPSDSWLGINNGTRQQHLQQ
ncbi:VTC domain-containing protein [Zychaea mexicana]|uniref:VTC domain-containing protein n=1 Tax=Zychaea mexicana TaxID=64656 RepID=UPI0022FE7269|nr:VTC domain-containing protein [Zychaea mexicana]KAI9498997.1 VTC domain-containing protein [Zychaea mexicana]